MVLIVKNCARKEFPVFPKASQAVLILMEQGGSQHGESRRKNDSNGDRVLTCGACFREIAIQPKGLKGPEVLGTVNLDEVETMPMANGCCLVEPDSHSNSHFFDISCITANIHRSMIIYDDLL